MEVLGLDEHMESVYRALLERSDWGIRELTEQFGQSEATIRTALGRLAELSLARQQKGDPSRWRAVNPELGLSAFLAHQEATLAHYQHKVQESREAMLVLLTQCDAVRFGSADREVQRLDGPIEVRLRLEQLFRQVTEEISVFCPAGPQSAEALECDRAMHAPVLERGVRIRALYLLSVTNDAANSAYSRWLTEFGAEVRTTAALPTRMVIADRSTAVVPLNPDEPSEGAILVTSPGLVTALCALFEQMWAPAAPFGMPRRRDEVGLTEQERELLRLLRDGLTDEAAARKLGVSLRTVRRVISDLMGRMQVKSRFQMGLVTGERGWLNRSRLLAVPNATEPRVVA